MYIKVNNGVIEKESYSIAELVKDNPQTSFPKEISNELLAEWNVFPLETLPVPSVDYTKNIIQKTPEFVGGKWIRGWEVVDATQNEIEKRLRDKKLENESLRAEAYRNESDPLFFKAQRGEIEMQVWLDKVAEIKARYS